MKQITKIIWSLVAFFLFFACNTLDVPPMNIVKDSDLFSEQAGVSAYMARMYSTIPIIDRQDYGGRGASIDGFEALPDRVVDTPSPSSGTQASWNNYPCIRDACYFLQEFPAYMDYFNEKFANAWMGEAYFIRAFCYFRMVQSFGGVPIVDRVLNYPEQTIEELKLPRDKEVDCYDFILRDLDEAIRLLPETSTANDGLAQGRVNKYVALAFKARVALTAGCIAKYGNESLAAWSNSEAVQNGIVGIPASKATEYFNAAWAAAKEVENSGLFELYGLNVTDPDDVVKSYRRMYLDKSVTNREMMFCRYYLYGYNATILDANCLPYQLGGSYAGHVCLTMDFVKLFEDINGNSVRWEDIVGADATYGSHLYTNPEDAFADMEPRFKAVVCYPGSMFKGERIEIRKGILRENSFTQNGVFNMNDVAISENLTQFYFNSARTDSMVIQGKSGMGYTNVTSTGFYCVKYFDEDLPREQVSSSNARGETPWPEIRYAEVLLTLAEAAVELGRPADAIPYMNAIRKRAGSKKVFTTVTLEDVRKERRMEFVWEGKTFWDLKRWRIFHKELDNSTFELMWPIYVWDKNAYYMRVTDTGTSDNRRFTYDERFYYSPVPENEISRNDKLIQNPGY